MADLKFEPVEDPPELAEFRKRIQDAMSTKPPKPGTKAADLTPSEKIWVARHSGVPITVGMEGATIRWETAVPCAIEDDGEGGYLVAMLEK